MTNGKPKPIIGMPLPEFQEMVQDGDHLHLHPARLLPRQRIGDERALASMLLAGLQMSPAFRAQVLSGALNMRKGGRLLAYSEPTFLQHDKNRADGLLLVIKGGSISNAVLMECKNGPNDLDPEQLKRYAQVAKAYGIPMVWTISNELVSRPTQTPVQGLKPPRGLSFLHTSLHALQVCASAAEHTVASAKSAGNPVERQVLSEMHTYMSDPKSGVQVGKMLPAAWTAMAKRITSGATVRMGDAEVQDVARGWQESERSAGLALSQRLQSKVSTGLPKFKSDRAGRTAHDAKHLTREGALESNFRVDGLDSPITMRVQFSKRNVEIGMVVACPTEGSSRARVTWLRRQLDAICAKNPDAAKQPMHVDISIKYARQPIRVSLPSLAKAHEMPEMQDKDITGFRVSWVRHVGRHMESRRKMSEWLHTLPQDFYQVAHRLRPWRKPAPKLQAPDAAALAPSPSRSTPRESPADAEAPPASIAP